MDAHASELFALALFVASELIGMSKLQSNSVIQLVVAALLRAFPYRR